MNKAHDIKVEKDQEYQEQVKLKEKLNEEINKLYNSKTQLTKDIQKEKRNFEELYENEKNKLSEQIEL